MFIIWIEWCVNGILCVIIAINAKVYPNKKKRKSRFNPVGSGEIIPFIPLCFIIERDITNIDNVDATPTNCYYIDSNIRITGVTTGYTIDVPVRFAKVV